MTQRQPTAAEVEQYTKAVHTIAVIAVVGCPMLALLPPRKLDFYTFGLVGTTVYSANFLLRSSTGRGAWQHLGGPPSPTDATQRTTASPSIVGEMQREMRGERTRDAWKVQREKEIRQDVEEGKSLQDMIVDQIWEVWNWGKPGDEAKKTDSD